MLRSSLLLATKMEEMAKLDGWVPAHSTFGVVSVCSSGQQMRNSCSRAVKGLREMVASFRLKSFKCWRLFKYCTGRKSFETDTPRTNEISGNSLLQVQTRLTITSNAQTFPVRVGARKGWTQPTIERLAPNNENLGPKPQPKALNRNPLTRTPRPNPSIRKPSPHTPHPNPQSQLARILLITLKPSVE